MSAHSSFSALGTTATVVVDDPRVLASARRVLMDEVERLDRACSRFRPDSELTKANERAGEEVHVTALFFDCLRAALDAAEATDGLVVPTLGGALRAAGYDRTFALVRRRAGWAARAVDPLPDAWRLIELDEDRRMVRVPPGAELDLGATAKALAADRAAARVAAETSTGVLVSLGGDIAVAGRAPGLGWPVRVADDHAAPLETPGPVVAVAAGGLATSSTRVRSWSTDGGVAHHVIDPRTGKPAVTPWRAVSVAAISCLAANVLATGALVVGAEAPRWLADRSAHARLVGADGAIRLVGGWPSEESAAA